MVLDGAALDDIHEQLTQEGESLVKEMRLYQGVYFHQL